MEIFWSFSLPHPGLMNGARIEGRPIEVRLDRLM